MMVHAGVFCGTTANGLEVRSVFHRAYSNAMAVESTVPIIVTLPLSMP